LISPKFHNHVFYINFATTVQDLIFIMIWLNYSKSYAFQLPEYRNIIKKSVLFRRSSFTLFTNRPFRPNTKFRYYGRKRV